MEAITSNIFQVSVMGKNMHTPSKFPAEGLGVLQIVFPLGGPPDVRDGDVAGK